MPFKVTDKTATVENTITQKASIFLRIAAETIVNISEPKTPKDKGNLRRDTLKQVLGLKGKVVWGKNYASYQEDKQYKNYTTPGTGPHYAENAVKQVIKDTPIVAKRSGLI